MEEPTCDIDKLRPLAYWIVSFDGYGVTRNKLFTSAVICYVSWISDPHLLRLIIWYLWRCKIQIMINMHCSHWRWGILIVESYTLMKITINMTTLRNCITSESTNVSKMIIFPTDLTVLSIPEFIGVNYMVILTTNLTSLPLRNITLLLWWRNIKKFQVQKTYNLQYLHSISFPLSLLLKDL